MHAPAFRRVLSLWSIALALVTSACTGPRHSETVSAQTLLQGFNELCSRLHYRVLKVDVDTSESPFLVYGAIEGHANYADMRDELNGMQNYGLGYGGSSTVTARDGTVTFFALNMLPDPSNSRVLERMTALARSQR